MADNSTIQFNLQQVRQQIDLLQQRYQRQTPVTLIGVSKTKPASLIAEAARAGLTDVAENYLQEALQKQAELADLQLTWHYIGPIQSNKTAKIAENFCWVHSVASKRIAQRLDRQRPPELGQLNVLIQVNVSGESSKSGVSLDAVPELAATVAALPNLSLRGLMTVPAHSNLLEQQRQPFHALRSLLQELQQSHGDSCLNQLSMGMTQDMEAAIAEGSTMVRIGTAIFGARQPRAAD